MCLYAHPSVPQSTGLKNVALSGLIFFWRFDICLHGCYSVGIPWLFSKILERTMYNVSLSSEGSINVALAAEAGYAIL